MQVTLAVLGGPSDGLEISLDLLPVTLGREGERRLPLQDRWASRHHCELFAQEGRLMIRDLASKHGTYVNGERVDERELAPGDALMIGLTVVSIRDIAADARPPLADAADRPSSVGGSRLM